MRLLHLDNVSLYHGDGAKLLHAGELSLARGERWLVDGSHGAGKTTFLKLLAGSVEPSRGCVERAENVRLGMMFTEGGLLSNLNLVDNIALPLRFAQGIAMREAVERARAALEEAGLSRMAMHRPHALSARVRRLAQVARLDATEPDIILLDEPLEGFGASDQAFVRSRIVRWCEAGTRCLVVCNLRGGDLGVSLRRLSLLDGSLRPEAPS
jgi:ABC-type taurine transport system ATPase subunit